MTIWILHQPMSEEEEAVLSQQTTLALPFVGLPDLSELAGPAQALEMLAALYPDDPPESINNRLDRFWPTFVKIHFEDLIAVPLLHRKEVVLAEVTGGYIYQVGEKGEDMHRIPVKFYPQIIPLRRFKQYREWFTATGNKIVEVTDDKLRIAIRDQLPHQYNRFVKYKWLMALFILMSLAQLYQRLATPW